jgi:hypothetical protein
MNSFVNLSDLVWNTARSSDPIVSNTSNNNNNIDANSISSDDIVSQLTGIIDKDDNVGNKRNSSIGDKYQYGISINDVGDDNEVINLRVMQGEDADEILNKSGKDQRNLSSKSKGKAAAEKINKRKKKLQKHKEDEPGFQLDGPTGTITTDKVDLKEVEPDPVVNKLEIDDVDDKGDTDVVKHPLSSGRRSTSPKRLSRYVSLKGNFSTKNSDSEDEDEAGNGAKSPIVFSDPLRVSRLARPTHHKMHNNYPYTDTNSPLYLATNFSNRATMNMQSDPARVARLSKPASSKVEKDPEPPRYCVDYYPLLPFDRVNQLQQLNNKFAVLPTDLIDCLRFTVTTSVPRNWKEEMNAPNRSFAQKRQNLIEKRPQSYQLDVKKLSSKLHAASEGRTSTTGTTMNKRELANYQYGEFSKKFSVGYIVVVLDIHMQIMGTYDCTSGMFMPGLTLTPAFLTKKIAKSKLKFNRANLMEIEFNRLPPETFAVVPVLLDESYIHPQHKHTLPLNDKSADPDPTAVAFTCDLFLKTRDPDHQLPAEDQDNRDDHRKGQSSSNDNHLRVHSELTKEEAERFLPQDYLMAQCDGVEDLYFKIATKVCDICLKVDRWMSH